MSSATSTNEPVPAPATAKGMAGPPKQREGGKDQGLQPWQFFVLAALGCATAVTFIARGQGITSVVLLGILMGTAALVGLGTLRALRPLVSAEDDRTQMIGRRTRAALEREKMLALRSIKELEFDRAMGKLSDADWQEMSGRLRARAGRLMRQLDAGTGYRQQIERDLAKRLGTDRARKADPTEVRRADPPGSSSPSTTCAKCATVNDPDARFCKGCGTRIE